MNKKVLVIAATAALFMGGAGYFTGTAVEGKASDEAVRAVDNKRIDDLSKANGKHMQEIADWESSYETHRQTCSEYVSKSEEVVQGLLTALGSSTSMISNPDDIGTMVEYTGVADGINALIPVKLAMEDLAVACAGEDTDAS